MSINPQAYEDSKRRLNKRCNLDLIDVANSSKRAQLFNDILNLLRVKLTEYPPHHILRTCNEFLVFCCNLIEESHRDEKKPDKKAIVINLYKHLFNTTDAENKLIESAIDFIHQNGLIHAIPKTKKIIYSLKKRIKSFF